MQQHQSENLTICIATNFHRKSENFIEIIQAIEQKQKCHGHTDMCKVLIIRKLLQVACFHDM